ncbi:hypothetical protein FNV43_RR21239 [Rhamnella rubrinervis]|uniref:Uncharacterized protein n=1 Tax=Rhamnella rubrinervis TaxID=2594499 RepID=A0A8K0GR92_9ROSA|nr:hypothetical protein FNV43_RR21239 [Rhamnella rubrinervis]
MRSISRGAGTELDVESSHHEQQHGLHTVARYLTGETHFIPLLEEGHYYMLSEGYEQRDADHRQDMMMWYLD